VLALTGIPSRFAISPAKEIKKDLNPSLHSPFPSANPC
jgi:hypothetical protein